MKRNRYIQGFLSLCFMATLTTGCDVNDMFKEDDGSDMSVLRVDLPTFDAEYVFHLMDVTTGQPYENSVKVRITGKSAHNICTDMGKTDVSTGGTFTASGGELNLYLNPNEHVSASDPIEFILYDDGDGTLILPHTIKQTIPGRYDATIGVMSLTGVKSAEGIAAANKVASYKPTYKVFKMTGLSGEKEDVTDKVTWFPYPMYNEDYIVKGVLLYTEGLYTVENVPADMDVSAVTTKKYTFIYEKHKATKRADVNIELTGSGQTSGTYYITTADGVYISGNLSGNLPLTRTVEGVTSSGDIKVEYIANPPYTASGAKTVSNAGGTASFQIAKDQAAKEKLYELELEAYGTDNQQIAVVISKPFKYAETSAVQNGQWISAQLVEGCASVYMKENTDYILRVNIDNKNNDFNFTTDLSRIQEIVQSNKEVRDITYEPTSQGYRFKVKVISEDLNDVL